MTLAGSGLRRWWRRTRLRPRTATGAIVAVTVLVFLVEVRYPVQVQNALGYNPCYAAPGMSRCVARFGEDIPFEPWRMLTVLLVHSPISIPYDLVPITHIAFNMYALYLFGRPIERVLGGARLLGLYLVSGLAGSAAVLWSAVIGLSSVETFVVGASGAVFGVLGAMATVYLRLGADIRGILVMIAINLVLGFVLPGVAWEAHVGGLLVGAVLGWVLVSRTGPRPPRAQWAALAAAAGAVVIATAAASLF